MVTAIAAAKPWRKPTIGVDLDGTLAFHEQHKPFNALHIGEPISKMVDRVKAWVAEGSVVVKVFTARMSDEDPAQCARINQAVGDWTEKHIGQRLEATCVKDYTFIQIWDDRAVHVVCNTGETTTPGFR